MPHDNQNEETERFAELQQVRLHRVYADPIITHQRNVDWGFADSDDLMSHIITARMKRLRTAPANAPIELATLPEAVAYLASASMDAGAATGVVPRLYQLAMREYVDEFGVEGPTWLGDELENEDYYRARLDALRREIMRAQTRNFLSEDFDGLALKRLTRDFWSDGDNSVSLGGTVTGD
ncbi:hypothetical protein [Haloarcula sp. H-GB5]